MAQEDMSSLMEKYKKKIESQLKSTHQKAQQPNEQVLSREYKSFKEEYLPHHFSQYEKYCNLAEKMVKVAPDPKTAAELQESINICHLNITPTGATSFAMLTPFALILLTSILSLLFLKSFFFVLFFIILKPEIKKDVAIP